MNQRRNVLMRCLLITCISAIFVACSRASAATTPTSTPTVTSTKNAGGGDSNIGDTHSPLLKQLIESHNRPSTQADRDKTPLSPDANRVLYFVRPHDTDSRIDQFLQDHYVIYNKAVASNGKLFVFFPGTFGRPHDYQFLVNEAANQGYKAIGLEYPDDQEDPNMSSVGQLCSNDPDLACADKVREERLTGIDASTKVTITPANSIENRLLKLLLYLQQQHPNERWNTFLQNGQIAWSRIAVGGHSQGSGFAAFIAKRYLVARVALWSGPSDYSQAARQFASWMTQASVTPVNRYFGIVHLKEPTYRGILAGWKVLGLDQFGGPVVTTQNAPPYSNSHELVVTLPPHAKKTAGNAYHGSTASDPATPLDSNNKPAYASQWRYIMGN